jgi:hypothetical protein
MTAVAKLRIAPFLLRKVCFVVWGASIGFVGHKTAAKGGKLTS